MNDDWHQGMASMLNQLTCIGNMLDLGLNTDSIICYLCGLFPEVSVSPHIKGMVTIPKLWVVQGLYEIICAERFPCCWVCSKRLPAMDRVFVFPQIHMLKP